MNDLEFISGFTIGHIIGKAINNNTINDYSFKKNIISGYHHLWSLFYSDPEFIRGLKQGLRLLELITTEENILNWIENVQKCNFDGGKMSYSDCYTRLCLDNCSHK